MLANWQALTNLIGPRMGLQVVQQSAAGKSPARRTSLKHSSIHGRTPSSNVAGRVTLFPINTIYIVQHVEQPRERATHSRSMLVFPNASKHAGKEATSALFRLQSPNSLRMEAGSRNESGNIQLV